MMNSSLLVFYADAWDAFKRSDDNVDALNHLHYLNPTRDGAPEIDLFGMCFCGAFSEGGKTTLTASQKQSSQPR